MKIHIINGPNLNLLGSRQPEIYGSQGFDSFLQELIRNYPETAFAYFQSNVEGELINLIQQSGRDADGIILNAGGYSHTSVAIADAIAAISVPVIEVHISNIYSREEFRQRSLLSPYCSGIITGFGLLSYELAILAFRRKKSKDNNG